MNTPAFEYMSKQARPILVVDLDGTLLRTDSLYESLWSAIEIDVVGAFKSLLALKNGRAAIKAELARLSDICVETLPFNQVVIEYVEKWKASGGRCALVTAADQSLAELIGNHVGLFDEIHGSNGTHNLKGGAKAEFLEQRYADNGYIYIGDSKADLPVWEKASQAITVDVSKNIADAVESFGLRVEHLNTLETKSNPFIRSLRPYQWVKNILVFLPLIAAQNFSAQTLLSGVFAFFVFSAVASSVYIVNDLLDITSDRAHPRKKYRPIAAGDISLINGMLMSLGLLVLALFAAFLIFDIQFFLLLCGYYAITTAYSVYLKRKLILDICLLAALYTFRIIAGGVASGVPLSIWLLAFALFLFFSLAAIKRWAELKDCHDRGVLKATGRGYHVDDIPFMKAMALSSGYLSVLLLAMYLNSPAVLDLYTNPEYMLGACLVLFYWLTHIIFVTHRGFMNDDPIVYAFKDRRSLVCIVAVVGFAISAAM